MMKEITLRIPENKFQFFMELIKSLSFVSIKDKEGDSKEEIIANLNSGFSEIKKIKDGTLQTISAKEFLGEL